MVTALITALLLIAIVAVVIWAFNSLVPAPPPVKVLVQAVGAIICILILLSAFTGGLHLNLT